MLHVGVIIPNGASQYVTHMDQSCHIHIFAEIDEFIESRTVT